MLERGTFYNLGVHIMKILNAVIITVVSTAATWIASKALYKNTKKEMEERCMKADSKFISELREKVLNAKTDLDVEKLKHQQVLTGLKAENESLKEKVERLQKVLKATQRKAYELYSKEVNHD